MYPRFNPEAEEVYQLALEVFMSIPEECTVHTMRHYQDTRKRFEDEGVDGVEYKAALKSLRLTIADELMINSIREKMGMGRTGSAHVH